MKKTTIIAAQLLVMMLFVSCPGNEQESPIPEEPTGNPSGNGNNPFSSIAGVTAIEDAIITTSELDESETWTLNEGNDISILTGTWNMDELDINTQSNPKYAKRYTVSITIEADTSTSGYLRTDTFIHDYSYAIAILGADKWETIKEADPDIEDSYTIDDEHFKVTYTSDEQGPYTSIAGCFGNAWTSYFNPEDSTPNTVQFFFNANSNMFKTYNPETEVTNIYVKQN